MPCGWGSSTPRPVTTSPTSPPTPPTSRTRSTSSVMSAELALRPASAADLPMLAEVHLAARRAAGDAFPHAVHGDDEVRAWVAGWDLTAYDVWLAALGAEVVGYARFTRSWLDDLYVHPDHQGSG